MDLEESNNTILIQLTIPVYTLSQRCSDFRMGILAGEKVQYLEIQRSPDCKLL